MELLRFVYKNFCENKRLLIFIIMGNFLTFVLALVVPYLNGFYFNIVIYTPSKEKIIKFGCLIVGLGVITTMLTYCFNIYKTKVQSQLVFKTMNEIIRCVQYSDYSESSKFNPSYLHQKINIDANKIWEILKLCNGERTVEQIKEDFATRYSYMNPTADFLKDVVVTLFAFDKLWALSWGKGGSPFMVNGTIKLNEKYDLIWATEDDIREIFAAYKMYADNTEYTYHNCPANRNKGLSDYQKETVLRSKMFYYKEDFFVLKDREGNVMGITSISNNHPETDILEITTLLVPEEILEQVLIGCEQLLKSLYPFNISKLRIKTIGSDLEMLEKQLFNCGFKKVSQLMDEYGKGNDLIIYDWTV